MQIILRGPAAAYEAEHTARIFFPGAEKAENLPETEDFVLAESHEMTDLILVRKDGRLYWRTDLRSPEADPEYALCKLEFGVCLTEGAKEVIYAISPQYPPAAQLS